MIDVGLLPDFAERWITLHVPATAQSSERAYGSASRFRARAFGSIAPRITHILAETRLVGDPQLVIVERPASDEPVARARQEEFSESGAAAPRLRAAARKPPPFGTATQSLAVLAVRLLYACPRCEGLSPRRDPAVKPRWSEHSARAPTLRNGRRR
jgi:hypothetical protein